MAITNKKTSIEWLVSESYGPNTEMFYFSEQSLSFLLRTVIYKGKPVCNPVLLVFWIYYNKFIAVDISNYRDICQSLQLIYTSSKDIAATFQI